MNELLDAAKDSRDSSNERYQKLKEEDAGTDKSKAEQRYEQLKEEAKQEFIERTQKMDEEQEENGEDSDDGFITH